MPWHISERGGGAEVQANYLAKELAVRGYEVSYVCQTKSNSKMNTTEKINDFEVVWLKPSGRFAWLDQNKYFDALKKINPDAVLQRMTSNVSFPIGKYCSSADKTFHWFCTDNEVPFKNWHIRKFRQNVKLKIANSLKYPVFYLNALLMDYCRNKGMKKVNVAWSQNVFQKEQLLKNFGLKTNTMISGHPMPKETVDHEKNYDRQTILWCANLGKRKRPELFIALANQMQHTNYKFVMVGGHSDQEYVDALFANQPDNLTVVGKCSFDEALAHFNSASVFINTSAAGGDGFPNTYIQAWLRGVPVYTMGFDPDSVIVRNKLGYNNSDINQLEEKLNHLLRDKESYIAMSKRVKHYSEQHHSIKVMTDNFVKHLNS